MGRSVHRGPFNFSKEVSRPPDHWLKLARETRALAERVNFDTAKKRLLELAKDYDRIAVRKHERKRKRRKETQTLTLPCDDTRQYAPAGRGGAMFYCSASSLHG